MDAKTISDIQADTMYSLVVDIINSKKTIAINDAFTFGEISNRITSIEGSSEILKYSRSDRECPNTSETMAKEIAGMGADIGIGIANEKDNKVNWCIYEKGKEKFMCGITNLNKEQTIIEAKMQVTKEVLECIRKLTLTI